MITIAIPLHHPVTLIARGRRYLFARLLLASGQTLVVELRQPSTEEIVDDLTGVVVDTFVGSTDDHLAMMTIEFAVRRISFVGRRVVRLEAIEPQRVHFRSAQTSR